MHIAKELNWLPSLDAGDNEAKLMTKYIAPDVGSMTSDISDQKPSTLPLGCRRVLKSLGTTVAVLLCWILPLSVILINIEQIS